MKAMFRPLLPTIAFATLLVGCSSCGKPPADSTGGGAVSLSGEIKVDGSSTVFPVSQAIAEEFMKANPGANVSVGESGTSAGFQKFLDGAIDVADASRPIDDKEAATAKEKGIEFVEIPIAYDGLTICVNNKNTWCDTLTVKELNEIWKPESKINNWKDVRPGFPDKPLKLFGAGEASGTYDYFNQAINGNKKLTRSDFQKSEDDNMTVTGVSDEEGGMGYFGFSFFEQNSSKLKAIKVDPGTGPVGPSEATINDGTYQPLSRPLFIYINKKSLAEKPALKAWVAFMLSSDGQALIKSTGIVTLPAEAYDLGKARAEAMTAGSIFAGKNIVGIKIADILKAESASK